jgi:hypothetical protein
MKHRILSLLLAACSVLALRADEGMWPLNLLSKIQDKMQARGLKLSAEDIYAINKSSAKDAVVRLMSKQGRMFCSGEIISSKGLFLTNHHCGYDAIQEIATPQDNILANGFWAKSMQEERRAGFNIGLLRKIEDVTTQVFNGVAINAPETERVAKIAAQVNVVRGNLLKALGDEAANYIIEVTPFYNGNQFLAMYYEVFRDIRLVGAPPENVGKFGGETDNWRWPRHTCDFSMFRIYTNANNKPADYNAANKAFTPYHHFPISLKGVKEGDFAMTMGYPGRTTRYTYSEGIRYLSGKERPMRVQVRRDIMDVYESYMKADKNVRLMYSSKLAGLGNYWNKFNGEAKELSKPEFFQKRKSAEKAFEQWVSANNKQDVYGDVTSLYDEAYAGMNKYGLYAVYFQDGVSNSVPMANVSQVYGIIKTQKDIAAMDVVKDSAKIRKMNAAVAKMIAGYSEGISEAYHEFNGNIEKQVIAVVLKHILMDLDHASLPASMLKMDEKFKHNYTAMANSLWSSSIFCDTVKLKKAMANFKAKNIEKDPLYTIIAGYVNMMNVDLKPTLDEITNKLARANRLYMAAQFEMEKDKVFAPDANGTMRLSYGTIESYKARDAVDYNYFTTSRGILEKYIPGDFEFDAPESLINIIKKKDFGRFADADGELHTCFLSNNDITGGNSGSPVINGNGELIGTAFDGNWEAIASDFGFMPSVQRTISVDIRYTLFIVEKLGGAGNIIAELELR